VKEFINKRTFPAGGLQTGRISVRDCAPSIMIAYQIARLADSGNQRILSTGGCFVRSEEEHRRVSPQDAKGVCETWKTASIDSRDMNLEV
jgi:hypothetical protein